MTVDRSAIWVLLEGVPTDDVQRVLDDYESYSAHAYKATPVRAELHDRIPVEWQHAVPMV